MKKNIELHIPLGFQLDDKIEYVKVWQAEKYLHSKRIKRYTKAVRYGEDAELHSHWLTCPHCGSKYVANANSPLFNRYVAFGLPALRPTKAQITDWATLQMSIFDEAEPHELLIVPPVSFLPRFCCPSCENESFRSASTRQVMLRAYNKKITVKCEVTQLDEILSLGWAKVNEIKLSFPIFEVLTFDFRRGAVYIKIENAQGETLCRRDITECPEQLKGGASCKLLTQNKLVLRNVKRLFQEMWGTQLPFTWRQLDIQNLFKMTMFVGYPKRFYDSIPFVHNSFRIDKDFRARAKRMHRPENLIGLYQKSALPQAKSIRRIMFEEPGLFFYLPVVEQVWESIGDPNLMARFLKSASVYGILSAIHMRPGISLYLRDFCRIRGTTILLANIEGDWNLLRQNAIDYCCMSQRMRLQVQQRWRNKGDQESIYESYSVPMCHPDETIKDCVIDGYTFVWLRNSNDYFVAAQQLNNCLRSWRPHDAPVVGVRKKKRFVAAIEVRERQVVQARAYDNGPISADTALDAALQKWMARYSLKWYTEDDTIDDAPMPF